MDSPADELQEKDPLKLTMGIGIVIGFPMGLALGIALGNVAIGIPVGIAIGLGLGNAFEKPKHPLTDREKKKKFLARMFAILFFVVGLFLILLYFLR